MRAPTGTRIEETGALCDQVEKQFARKFRRTRSRMILDNIGLPYSRQLSLQHFGAHRPGRRGHHRLADRRPSSHGRVHCDDCAATCREFPGVTFYFLPADIVSQILNFGLPAPIDVQVVGSDLDANASSPTSC